MKKNFYGSFSLKHTAPFGSSNSNYTVTLMMIMKTVVMEMMMAITYSPYYVPSLGQMIYKYFFI